MSQLVEGSVSVFSDNTIIVQFTVECENALMLKIEQTRLEGWLTQLAKDQQAPYGTIRRNAAGEVTYGNLEE